LLVTHHDEKPPGVFILSARARSDQSLSRPADVPGGLVVNGLR
jgi:hypothetical protein